MLPSVYRTALGLGMAALLGLGQARAQVAYQSIAPYHDYPFKASEPLNVLLPEPLAEPELSKEYKKPEKRAAYLAEVNAQRTALQLALRHWTLSPVTVVTLAQAEQLAQDKLARHLLLAIGPAQQESHNAQGVTSSYYYVPALLLCNAGGGYRPTSGRMTAGIAGHLSTTAMFAQFYWPFGDQGWQELHPASELATAVQQFQTHVQLLLGGQSSRDIDKAAKASLGSSADFLRSHTLLLSRNQLSKSLTESNLPKVYPYPTQLVDQATFDAAVAAADTRYVYARYVTLRKDKCYQLLDAGTGKVLGWSPFYGSRDDTGHLADDEVKHLVKTATRN